jgi:hypothetical protein
MRITTNTLAILVTSLLLSLQCSKENPLDADYPKIITDQNILINSTGAIFKASIVSFGALPIIDHGFEWKLKNDVDYDRISLGSLSENGFDALASRGLEPSSDYEVRAFVKTTLVTSFGDWVKFTGAGSLPPIIKDFYPKLATWGDSVWIKGSNFSFNSKIVKVDFDGVNANVTSASDTLIKAIVPATYIKSIKTKLRISIGSKMSSTDQDFQLKPTVFTKITPTKAGSNTQVTITGKFFSKNGLSIKFGEINIPLDEIFTDSIKFRLPKEVKGGDNDIIIKSGAFDVMVPKAFIRTYPKVLEVIPDNGFCGDTIVLKGEGFGSQFSDTFITSNKEYSYIQILESKINELKIIVPFSDFTELNFKIKADFVEQVSEKTYKINPPEIKTIDPTKYLYPGQIINITGKGFPGFYSPNGNQLLIGDQIPFMRSLSRNIITIEMPIVSNHSSKFTFANQGITRTTYSEDISSPLIKSTIVPGAIRWQSTSFVVNNKIFITGGDVRIDRNGFSELDHKVYTFDTDSKAWTSLKDFPGDARRSAVAFSLGENGYLLGGQNSLYRQLTDLWRYDSFNDTWTQLADGPILAKEAFNLNGEIFCSSKDGQFWKYSQSADSWTKKESLGNNFYNSFFMQINDDLYQCLTPNYDPYNYKCYRYDRMNDKWLYINSFNFTSALFRGYSLDFNGIALVINEDKIYKFNPNLNSWDIFVNKVKNIEEGGNPIRCKVNSRWYFGLFDFNLSHDDPLRNIIYCFDGSKAGIK